MTENYDNKILQEDDLTDDDLNNPEKLIYLRQIARTQKNWKLSDMLRNILDSKLIFVFDTKNGQDIHYLTPEFFKHQIDFDIIATSTREYVETIIQRDLRAEKNFNAWLFTMNERIKAGTWKV